MNNLPIFKNELKNKVVAKYKLIGIVSEMILSFEIFANNPSLIPFIQRIFNKEYRPYVFSSRTILLSRIARAIDNAPDEDIANYKAQLYSFIEEVLHDSK